MASQMASSFVIAKRYSKAFLESLNTKDSSSLNEMNNLFLNFSETIQKSQELSDLLASPEFSSEEKFKVLKAMSQAHKLPENFEKFLKVVSSANRADLLVEIQTHFKNLVLLVDTAVEAHIETAVPLSPTHALEITTLISKLIGKKINLIQSVNPDLIAGIRLSVMGRTLDSTLPSSLEWIHRELVQSEA
jgi:F-type H+-transporting ATPase subunit delta